jgi:prevent-host-death family protein
MKPGSPEPETLLLQHVQPRTIVSMQINVSEARAKLPELLDRVGAGEEVTLTRHGVAVAVLVRPDSLRVRRGEAVRLRAAELHTMMLESRGKPLSPKGVMSAQRAEELVSEIRRDRDAD